MVLEFVRSADALDQLAVLNFLRDSKSSSTGVNNKLSYLMPAWESKSKTYLGSQGGLITFLYIPAMCKNIKKLITQHIIAIKPPPDICIHCKTLNPQISVLESVISFLRLFQSSHEKCKTQGAG